jgi:hypothetical protein
MACSAISPKTAPRLVPHQAVKRPSIPSAQAQIAQTAAAGSFTAPLPKAVQVMQFAAKPSENDVNLFAMWPAFVKSLKSVGVAVDAKEMPQNAEGVRAWLNTHLKEIAKIKDLNFCNLKLTAIPIEFFTLPLQNLLLLSFGRNDLKTLPEGFGKNFPRLQHLFLYMNKLKSLPSDFCAECHDLRVLELSFNQIAMLDPKHMGNWENLEEFSLCSNLLPGLSDTFGKNWKKLKKLDLSSNRIKKVPDHLRALWPWWREGVVLRDNPILCARWEMIFQKAMSCPEVKALYDQAKKEANWQFRFEKPPHEHWGECDGVKKIITVDPGLNDDSALSVLIFELTNAGNQKPFAKATIDAQYGKLDRDGFAKTYESIEHQGALLHHKIVSAAVQKLGWSPDVDAYKKLEPDFEKHWPKIQHSSHANAYRRFWDAIPKVTSAKGSVSPPAAQPS